jgi:hypothetical protein
MLADRSPSGITQSLYPGRPRGGLTIVPSRHFSNSADLGRSRGFYKSAPPRTLPVMRTAPWPHALWNIEWTATLEYSSEGGSP